MKVRELIKKEKRKHESRIAEEIKQDKRGIIIELWKNIRKICGKVEKKKERLRIHEEGKEVERGDGNTEQKSFRNKSTRLIRI